MPKGWSLSRSPVDITDLYTRTAFGLEPVIWHADAGIHNRVATACEKDRMNAGLHIPLSLSKTIIYRMLVVGGMLYARRYPSRPF